MNRDQIMVQVRQLLAEQLTIDPTKITEQSTLDELGADSLDRVEIIMKLEDLFGVEISDDDADRLTSVDSIVAYLERNLHQ